MVEEEEKIDVTPVGSIVSLPQGALDSPNYDLQETRKDFKKMTKSNRNDRNLESMATGRSKS